MRTNNSSLTSNDKAYLADAKQRMIAADNHPDLIKNEAIPSRVNFTIKNLGLTLSYKFVKDLEQDIILAQLMTNTEWNYDTSLMIGESNYV